MRSTENQRDKERKMERERERERGGVSIFPDYSGIESHRIALLPRNSWSRARALRSSFNYALGRIARAQLSLARDNEGNERHFRCNVITRAFQSRNVARDFSKGETLNTEERISKRWFAEIALKCTPAHGEVI